MRIRTETGFATYLVIIVIVIMGVLLAGLLPFGTTVTQSAAYTKNTLQAQYIAEAGAKRAIAALESSSTAWSWLGSDVAKADGATSATKYKVAITSSGTALSNGNAPAAGTYTITSVGYYGKFSKTVTVKVVVASVNFSSLSADFVIGGNVSTTKTTANIQSNGDMTVNGTVASNITTSGSIANLVTQNAKITIPAVDTYFDALRAQATAEFWAQKSSQTLNLSNSSTIYYEDSPGLTITGSSGISNLQGASGSNSYSIVLVDGDLTFDSSVTSLNQTGNVVFIVNGALYINSNNVSFANCCFFCSNAYIGNSSASGNSNFTVKLVVESDLVLNASLTNSNPASFDSLDEYLESLVGGSSTTVSNWAKGT